MAVSPQRSGLARQRQSGDALGELLVVEGAVEDMRVLIGLLDPIGPDIVVGDARGVAHQVQDGDGAHRWHQFDCNRTVRLLHLLPDFRLGKGRNVF